MKIDISKIRVLNLSPDDTLVVQFKDFSERDAVELATFLKCRMIRVADIEKIGVIKFSPKKPKPKTKTK